MVRPQCATTPPTSVTRVVLLRLSTLLPLASALGYLVITVIPELHRGALLVFVEVTLTLVPALSAGLLGETARVRRSPQLWLLAASCAAWAVGSMIWNFYGLILGGPVPLPSFADPFYLLFLPLAAAAVLFLISDSSRAVGRLRMICDSLISGIALFAAAWPLVLRPAIDDGSNLIGQVVSCAYPVGDVALLALVLPAISRVAPCWRPVLKRTGIAFLALTASDILFAVLSATGTWSSSNPASVGWVLAFAALGSVASVWPTDARADEDVNAASEHRSTSSALLLLGYLPVLTGSAVALWQIVSGDLDVVGGLAILAVVALGTLRQQLAFWENDSLTRHLEDRVAIRTTELAQLAYTDLLTGLANRASFAKVLTQLTAAGQPPTVVLLDLDGFKTINDTLGHAAGDELLVRVGGRLRRACSSARLLARLGGDEFAVVLPADAEPDAPTCATHILAELMAPFHLDSGDASEVRIGASIGIAGLPSSDFLSRSVDSRDVLRDADIAMYAAKAAGRNRWRAFDPEMRRATEDRKSLEDDLHAAVWNGELTLAYQPVMHLATSRIVGTEALLRWDHPVRGMVPPVEFIPVAEETGLIVPIGTWVLQEACRQTAAWKALLPPTDEFGCGINLSVRQLQPGLLDIVQSALDTSGLPPAALVLEITESIFMDDGRTDPELLQHLRQLGPKIFLDDFGTGFSSLSYLRRFPVDGLKIDRSFVAPLSSNDDEVLAAAIIGLAESLHLGVVAEGIEDNAQRFSLQAMGCELGQGFGMHRPMSAEAMTALLTERLSLPAQRASEAAMPSRVVDGT